MSFYADADGHSLRQPQEMGMTRNLAEEVEEEFSWVRPSGG